MEECLGLANNPDIIMETFLLETLEGTGDTPRRDSVPLPQVQVMLSVSAIHTVNNNHPQIEKYWREVESKIFRHKL